MDYCVLAKNLSHDGYPTDGAHRKNYEKTKGPIPPGYEIDHLCRNPSCVNPNHLEAVTKLENNRRKPLKIPVEDRKVILQRLLNGEGAANIAKEYAVTEQRIHQLKKVFVPKSAPLLDSVEELLS